MPNNIIRIRVAVDIPREVDRALEIECAKRDVLKRQMIEDALRAFLRLPAKQNAT
jgi:hypothetical protein